MNKNTIWIIAAVIAVVVICCVGSVAVYYLYTSGWSPMPTATPFLFPTPNKTLTALYQLPTLSLPTATQQYLAPTYSGGPTITSTIPMPTMSYGIPSPTATVTATAVANRTYGVADAAFLATAPTLDGIWDEWSTTEYPIGSVVYGKGNWEGSGDLLGSYRIGWDNTYLYVAFKVHDDRYTQVSSGGNLYMGDSLEVLLDTNLEGDLYVKNLSGDDYQIGISPGKPTPGTAPEAYLWFPVSLTGARSSIKIAAVGGDGLYRLEAAIPWSVVNVTPYKGLKMGFAASVSDDDLAGTARQQTMISNSSTRSLADPTTWGMLTLK